MSRGLTMEISPLALRRAGARVGFRGELGVPRRLGEHVVDLGDGARLVHALHRRDLPGHAVESRFIELTLGVGLLRLRLGPVQVAHHLGDSHEVAGIDLGLVFLRPARSASEEVVPKALTVGVRIL